MWFKIALDADQFNSRAIADDCSTRAFQADYMFGSKIEYQSFTKSPHDAPRADQDVLAGRVEVTFKCRNTSAATRPARSPSLSLYVGGAA